MKKLSVLHFFILSSMLAIESPNRFGISWQEMVEISNYWYLVHGENVDLPDLLLNECRKDKPVENRESKSPVELKTQAEVKLKRRITSQKINDDLKLACDKLRGIVKISSYP